MGLASFGTGFGLGFGTGFLARDLIPIAQEIIKPIVRVAVKSTFRLFERSRETLAYMGESLEDLMAEVHVEMRAARRKKAGTKKKKKELGGHTVPAEGRKAAA